MKSVYAVYHVTTETGKDGYEAITGQMTDIYEDYGRAKNVVDENTEANLRLEGLTTKRTYGVMVTPEYERTVMPLREFGRWQGDDVLYGTEVRNHNSSITTYRFIYKLEIK